MRNAHGRRRRPRLQGADEADRRPRSCPGDLGDGEPADRQRPRGRHGSVLEQGPRCQALARPRLRRGHREGADRLPAADERDPQGVALHHVRLLRLGVQLDGVRPGLPRPGRARERLPLRRRCPRPGRHRAAEHAQRGARDLGLHALLLLQRALSQGRRPARRDRQARRRVDQAGDRPRHGREARQVVRQVGGDDGLAARDRARAEDAGRDLRDQGGQVRAQAFPARQGAGTGAAARRRERARGAGAPRARTRPGSRRGARDRPGRALARPHRTIGLGRREPGRSREVASVKVAYYKGCLAALSAKELDISTRALAPKLGIELDELESVTCCGAGDIHEAEPDYYLHLNARILAYGEATGADTLMTICNVCTLNLRQANWQLKNDDALRTRVNENLERVGVPAYSGGIEVKHFLWLIAEGEGFELLKQVAHKGLRGLRIAPFYGCQILRPSKLLGFEDPDRPWSLEAIIEACGGEPIDYPAKIKCCGFPIIAAREDVALGELIQPIEQAKDAGADVMVTPCPLCHLSLDAWQSKLKKATGRTFDMPILHLSQLIGVAAGLDESELRFKRHVVPVDPVLARVEGPS